MSVRQGRAAALAFLLALLTVSPPVHGATSVVSGSYNYVVPSTQGTSSYTVVWSYPSSVTVGQKLNVTATLFLDGLTGLKLFADTYLLSAFVDLPGRAFVGENNVSSYFGCGLPKGCGSPHIYPGGHWGPENISIVIGNPPGGLGPSGATATVSVGFVTTVWYDAPTSQDYQESGSRVVGNITIVPASGSAGPDTLPYFAGFVALGGVIGPLVLYAYGRVGGKKQGASSTAGGTP